MTDSLLFEFLEEKYQKFNCLSFIESDPIQIPHLFSNKNDIEISAFLTSTIAWGQRKTILHNAKKMMNIMDNNPYDFVINHSDKDLKYFEGFVHRTFKDTDLLFFINSLGRILNKHKTLKAYFTSEYSKSKSIKDTIISFRKDFFIPKHNKYTERHLSNIEKGSAAKRMNMFLRWMIRKDKNKVDFGIWEDIPASALYIPLDVHTARVGRQLKLLKRKSNDWKAVEEFTEYLRKFDSNDPVKHDFALFGMGVNNDILSLK
jgi:uncharacterized protein (TIGR02757 family)